MLIDESMTEAVTHPIWATSITMFSSSVTQTGVQKRDKRIKSEKERKRSESRQSWPGVCLCEMYSIGFDMYPLTKCMCQGDEQELVGSLMACLLIMRLVG